ncbi:MAG: Protein containing Prepilin-type [Planctomycetota bacterium]|nr:MAG: Protein containing Prepilin-type [Planctomycetota bacterium]
MRRNGFTLIELLVVIAILGFLAATLVVAALGLKQRAKIENTAKLVKRLDTACEAYFTKFQDYPSDFARLTAAEKKAGASWPAIASDSYLFDYLGRPLVVVTGYGSGGGKSESLPPFLEFSTSEMSGSWSGAHSVKILDAWGNPIWYELPGFAHGSSHLDTSRGPSSSTDSRFDITSPGPDGSYNPLADKTDPTDNITNWTR